MPLDNAAADAVPTPNRLWRVEMLGCLRAVPQGSGSSSPVEEFRTHKTALLLAYLALYSHRAHARDELVDLLWPDAPLDRGRANLSQTLLYLRQAFGETKTDRLFVADHKTVRVQKNALQTDVADWEAAAQTALAAAPGGDDAETAPLLQAARAGYGGDFLPGFYDGWVSDERARLMELRDQIQARLHQLPAAVVAAASASHLPHPKIAPGGTATQKGTPPKIENAPLLLTRFFGRETERADADQRLRQNPPVRLLTLLGMGGIGKTRLALQIAHDVVCERDDKRDSPFGWAAFVPLAEAQTSEHMENALLHVLNLQTGSAADGLSTVIAHLSAKPGRLLLLLDNLEQLGEAAAPVIARLLAHIPPLTILATSRQPIGIAGEQEIAVGPLRDVLEGEANETPSEAAVQLFVDRARLVRSGFALARENEQAVGELCRVLEGVPLALELAAAWARVLTPGQISARLNHRFDLLALRGASGLDTPKRHRSLHAAIAWSYDLLGPSLQNVFAQLSVFRGGWTAEAAQAVTGLSDMSEPLLLLAERSLILTEGNERDAAVPRYRMLESLREFADEQLSDAERDRLRLRHARYFDTLTAEAEHRMEAGQMRAARLLMDNENDNIRTALSWSLPSNEPTKTVSPEGIVCGVQIAMRTVLVWSAGEAAPFVKGAAAALPLVSDPTVRGVLQAKLWRVQGSAAFYTGDYERAKQYLCQSLAAYEAAGDQKAIDRVKSRLASLAAALGDRETALSLWQEGLQSARDTGDFFCEAGYLNNLANRHADVSVRRQFIEQAVALYRVHAAPGSYFLACSLCNMGSIAGEQKDFLTAQACLEEAYDLARADGAVGTIGLAQIGLAELFLQTGHHLDRAHELLHAAQTLFEEKGEVPRVAQVRLLRFRLALGCDAPDKAVEQAGHYLRVSQQMGRDAAWLQNTRDSLVSDLRKAGFDSPAERLAKVLV